MPHACSSLWSDVNFNPRSNQDPAIQEQGNSAGSRRDFDFLGLTGILRAGRLQPSVLC